LFIVDAITGVPLNFARPRNGPVMGWKYARRKSIVLLILAAGVVIPAILFFV
jgi:hypothetical protein